MTKIAHKPLTWDRTIEDVQNWRLQLKAASHVRVMAGVRPYGGKRLKLIEFNSDTNVVLVKAPGKPDSRLTFWLHEIDPA